MQEHNELAKPNYVRGLIALIALIAILAVGMFYPLSESVSEAEATNAPEQSAAPADLSRFRADAWFLPDEPLLGFVHVPAGSFVMGSDPTVDRMAFDNERWSQTQVQGTVDLPDFYISRYEVTVAQFNAFVDATGYAFDQQTLSAPADHPIVGVSWTDALAYARWLQAELERSPNAPAELKELLQRGWRITLPSEAEWEKAARGDDGRIFPWGDAPRRERANFSSRGTLPVGSFDCPECPYGLADMSGNAWEWTRSPFQPLPYDEGDDREGLDEDALWVMRGGAFSDPPQMARAAVRGGADPGVRRPFIGFRLAISEF